MSAAPAGAEQVPAQFQLYRTAANSVVWWRLLSGNHRPIGRSAVSYDGVEECLAALARLGSVLDQLEMLTSRTPTNLWIWKAMYDGQQLALSAHAYDRQIRAAHAQAHFQLRAANARVSGAVMVTATRRWRSLAGAGSRESIR